MSAHLIPALVALNLLALGDTEPILGLLALPEVFGEAPCQDFEPGEIALFARPAADASAPGDPIAFIRVDRPWTHHPQGGCEGLRVGVHPVGAAESAPLPTREFGYELPGAVVLEREEGWFRIRTPSGSAWLRATERTEYLPLEELLSDALAYMTEGWDGPLAPEPGRTAMAAELDRVGSDPTHWEGMSATLEAHRWLGEELWLEVSVLNHSVCEGPEPRVVGRGWLPAHGPTGEVTVWFHSRGC